ncbi:GNAT family N-acetyltransferase [Rathayibacter oskolensis]|uniref:GNAT family N-acetyltransferase n=1 Tax=Rathayibacter oskolensis TaxID=1891671 RepID=UPI003466A4DF
MLLDGRVVGTTSSPTSTRPRRRRTSAGPPTPPRSGPRRSTRTRRLLLGLAFDSGYSRVKLQADAANARSRAAILRLGAVFEGVLRHDQRRADGSWRDTAVHSILVEEWPAVRDALDRRITSARQRVGGSPRNRVHLPAGRG